MTRKSILMKAANRSFFSKVASGMFNIQINHENYNSFHNGTTFEKTITIIKVDGEPWEVCW